VSKYLSHETYILNIVSLSLLLGCYDAPELINDDLEVGRLVDEGMNVKAI